MKSTTLSQELIIVKTTKVRHLHIDLIQNALITRPSQAKHVNADVRFYVVYLHYVR